MVGCGESPSTAHHSSASIPAENCPPQTQVSSKVIEYRNLPSPVINSLDQNSVFAEMKLIKATKVSSGHGAVYSLAFEDEEKFIIRAKFNESGRLIPYDSQPIEVAQPLNKQPKK